MAAVDRNILRLAIYEMLHRDDIPPVVSINEAVDIAKKFSTQDSGKFVNGILDKVKGELMRPARDREMKDANSWSTCQDCAAGCQRAVFQSLHFTFNAICSPTSISTRISPTAPSRPRKWWRTAQRHGSRGAGPDRPRHRRRLRAHGGGLRGGGH